MSRLLSFFSSKPAPHKQRTHAEVFDELISSLCEKGNHDLRKPLALGSQNLLDDLKEIYHQLALQCFESTFGYPYSKESSTPLDVAPNTKLVAVFDEFHQLKNSHQIRHSRESFDEAEDTSTTTKGHEDVAHEPELKPRSLLVMDTQKTLTKAISDLQKHLSNLPSWSIDKAKMALMHEVEEATKLPASNNGWNQRSLSNTYDVPDKKYDDSLRENVLLMCVHGAITDGKVTAELVAFYCIGVYYHTLPTPKLAKQAIWTSLCDGANKLLDDPVPVSTPPTLGELKIILKVFGASIFAKDFDIKLDSIPEDSVEFLGRAATLLVFEDGDLSGLDKRLDDSVLGPLQLPKWTTAPDDIKTQARYLLNDTVHNHGDWVSVKFERTYLPSKPSAPSVMVRANFVYCNVVSPRFPDVSFRCVYIVGLFYKVAGAKDTVTSDFIKAVYSTARTLVPESQIPIPDAPTKDDLDELLFSARDAHFEKKFGFKIDGENTKPPSAVPGVLFTATGAFETDPSQDAALLVDAHILKVFNLPPWINETALKKSLREDLIFKIQHALEQDPVAIGPNQWTVTELDRTYAYAAENEPPLCGKLIFVYCNGSMTEANQQMTLKKTFVYFSGVYYNQQQLDW